MIPDRNGVWHGLALHPVHLAEYESQLPPSALVPFCSYQMDSSLIGGGRIPELNQTVCNKFEPTILEGQPCFSLDVAKIDTRPKREGKTNGLFLALDPSTFQGSSDDRNNGAENDKQQSFKVYIHTLSQYTAYGPGTYAMTALKRMSGTKSFVQLPDKQKECRVHNRGECQIQHFLEKIKKNCGCIPWALVSDKQAKKVGFNIKQDCQPLKIVLSNRKGSIVAQKRRTASKMKL